MMYRIYIPKEQPLKINWLFLLVGSGTFLLVIIGIYTLKNMPVARINPILFLGILIVPASVTAYFTKKYVQSKSIHIFAPGGYFWSVLMLGVKTIPLPMTDQEGKSLTSYFLVVPLEGGAIPNWLPYMGGKRYGFLVIDKDLFLDLGGNILAHAAIEEMKVWDLFPTLRREVLRMKSFKKAGNPDKVPIFYGGISWKLTDSDIVKEMKSTDKEKTVGEIRQKYLSNIRYARHLEDELATSEAAERVLDDALNRKPTLNREKEEEIKIEE